MISIFVATLTLLAPAQNAAPMPPPKAPEPEAPKPPAWIRSVTLRSGPAPYRALGSPLLPALADLVSGNAVVCYYRAFSPESYGHQKRFKEWWKTDEAWSKSTLAALPRQDMEFLLTYWPLEQMEIGARRTYCDWEMAERLKKNGFSTLLPDMQGLRELGRLMGHRIRLKLAKNDYPGALRDIQTLLAMGRHVAAGPTLIQHLVGIAILSIGFERLEEALQQPGFPNLHWDLAILPNPLTDITMALEGEKLGVDGEFPALSTDRVMSHDEALKITERYKRLLSMQGEDPTATASVILGLSLISYTGSKAWLVERGVPRERVEAMPVAQVVMLRSVGEFDRLRDEMFKFSQLPLWQAAPLLKAADKKLKEEANNPSAILARLLLPAVSRVMEARFRVERRIAMLRLIEGLRLHASRTGELPENLEILKLPLPMDPFTGKGFQYTRTAANQAILLGPARNGDSNAAGNTLEYQITWKK